jgi:hypothetical protein
LILPRVSLARGALSAPSKLMDSSFGAGRAVTESCESIRAHREKGSDGCDNLGGLRLESAMSDAENPVALELQGGIT